MTNGQGLSWLGPEQSQPNQTLDEFLHHLTSKGSQEPHTAAPDYVTPTSKQSALADIAKTDIFHTLPKSSLNIPIYNAYFRSLMATQEYEEIKRTFDTQIRNSNLLPDQTTYELLVGAFAKTHDLQGAYEVIEKARKQLSRVLKTSFWLKAGVRVTVGVEIGKYAGLTLSMTLQPHMEDMAQKAGIHDALAVAGWATTLGVILGARLAVGKALEEVWVWAPQLRRRAIADAEAPTQSALGEHNASLSDFYLPKGAKQLQKDLYQHLLRELQSGMKSGHHISQHEIDRVKQKMVDLGLQPD
ncbi:hypothetical protein BZG36_05675 [Bifiguratus adelaidae]|uniref:Uncharacterized protein n=1 Tax=Bifiguratus adelaidae TaxID=1938954 RepID=A0A261XSR9_9FUNG|nr:hypothetical protein BZG36_05675 [Bifiguratus adelaidae]